MAFCQAPTSVSIRYTHAPPSGSPLPPPRLSPLGGHRVLALGRLHHTADSRWLSILDRVTYVFQRYSLISSPPLHPHCWVQNVCVSFAALQVGSSVRECVFKRSFYFFKQTASRTTEPQVTVEKCPIVP